jgi:hypothetical protein
VDFIVVGIGLWGKEWCKLLKKHPTASVVATVDLNETGPNYDLGDWVRHRDKYCDAG